MLRPYQTRLLKAFALAGHILCGLGFCLWQAQRCAHVDTRIPYEYLASTH